MSESECLKNQLDKMIQTEGIETLLSRSQEKEGDVMAQERDDLILNALNRIENNQDEMNKSVHSIDKRVVRIETKIENIESHQVHVNPIISALQQDVSEITTAHEVRATDSRIRILKLSAVGVAIAAITGFVASIGGWQPIVRLFWKGG